MSESGQTAGDEGRSNLEQHPLVEALMPDPSQGPPNATALQGFLGKSTSEGVWRLYLTVALDEYVEIAEADILHSRQLPDDQGTVVWVPKTLQLQHIRTQAQQVQADMLSGALAAANLPTTVGPVGGFAGPVPTPPIPIPTSAQFLCPTPSAVGRCGPLTLPFCPSEAMIRCPTLPIACRSEIIRCGPLTLPFCPSEAMIRCPVTLPIQCGPVTLPFCPSEAMIGCGPVSLACPA
jgi:hypothetical protein